MRTEIQITGLDRYIANIGRGHDAMMRGAGVGLYRASELEIIGPAKERCIPVDEAVLKTSARTDEPVVTSKEASVENGVGGPAEDYAKVQHEDLSFKHTVGGPKYLERPLLAALSKIPAHIGQAIREELANTFGR